MSPCMCKRLIRAELNEEENNSEESERHFFNLLIFAK